MSAPQPDPSDLLATARRLAAAGAWDELRSTLSQLPSGTAPMPEFNLLLAEATLRLGDLAGARSMLTDTIPLLERGGEPASLRRGVNLLGAAHFELGELADAETAFSRVLDLANSANDPLMVARATNNLGLISNIRGQRESALGSYRLAIAAFQQIGHKLGLAEVMHNLAITHRDIRQFDQADRYERRAIEFAREAGSSRILAMAQAGRAELSLLQGEPQVAEAGARMAVREYVALKDPVGESDAQRLLGRALGAIGETNEALVCLDRAVHMARAQQNALIEAESLRDRAELRAASGDRSGARDDGEAAVALYGRLGATQEEAALRDWLRTLTVQPA